MPRVKNPLPDMTDAEILRKVAAIFDYQASKHEGHARRARRALAARLYSLARRVPLWIDRQKETGR